MTLVAFERFFSITFPFKKIVTKTRAKFIMSILFIICLIIGLLGALSIGIYHRVLSLRTYNGTFLEHAEFHNENPAKNINNMNRNKLELRKLPDSIAAYFKNANAFTNLNKENDKFLSDLITKSFLSADLNQNTLHNSSVIEIDLNRENQPKPVFSRNFYKNLTK